MAMGRENFQSLFSLAEKCSIKESVINNSNREILFYLKDEKFNDSLAKFVNRMRKEKKQLDVLPEFACHLSNSYRASGQNSESKIWLNQCKELIATAQKSRTLLSKKSLDASVQEEIFDLRSSLKKLRSIRLTFPEATFKQVLTKKLSLLEEINSQATRLQKIGSPEGIYQSFDVLFMAYGEASKEIEEFIPSGVNDDYKKSFRASMAQIAAPLKAKSQQIFRQGRKILEEQNILVKGNRESAFHITLEEEVNYMGDFN